MSDERPDAGTPGYDRPVLPPGARPLRGGARAHDGGADPRSVRDRFAFVSLIAGICAWVPLVIVAAAPISFGFALLSMARTEGGGRGKLPAAARAGVYLASVAVVLQVMVFSTASVFGWADAAVRWLFGLVTGAFAASL